MSPKILKSRRQIAQSIDLHFLDRQWATVTYTDKLNYFRLAIIIYRPVAKNENRYNNTVT